DRFCEVMISIREEIREVEAGKADQKDNVLKNAPHTLKVVMVENWERPYAREKAVYPMAYLRDNKVWPTVSRIDSAYGDRTLVCSCAFIRCGGGPPLRVARPRSCHPRLRRVPRTPWRTSGRS